MWSPSLKAAWAALSDRAVCTRPARIAKALLVPADAVMRALARAGLRHRAVVARPAVVAVATAVDADAMAGAVARADGALLTAVSREAWRTRAAVIVDVVDALAAMLAWGRSALVDIVVARVALVCVLVYAYSLQRIARGCFALQLGASLFVAKI